MKKSQINSSRIPVYRDAGFELYDADITADVFEKEKHPEHEPDRYIYSRYRNPTVVSAEKELMNLEGSGWAILSQSGMSAIEISLSIFQKGRQTPPMMFFTEIYGGTISYIDSVLVEKRGVDVSFFTPSDEKYDLDLFDKVVSETRPGLVYIETISNPMLIVADIENIITIAKKYGCKVIVDNTFATPFLCKPLDYGADLVIHSATKYLSGHGNITAGVICGNDTGMLQEIISYRKLAGHMISPDDAYRLQTQMESFSLRFRRQCDNAVKIAELLEESNVVQKVFYPGLNNHTTHEIAADLFRNKGFGGIITFDLEGKDPDEKKLRRDKFIGLVSEKIRLIPSLGDSKTILMPVQAVWGYKYPEPGMIRLSTGIEDFEELENTITAALQKL